MKRNLTLIFLITGFFLYPREVIAQSLADSLFMQWAEFIEDDSNLGEILQDLAENPVNINTDDPDELKRIPLITSRQADSILHKRQILGTYKSKRQIESIVGSELYAMIRDFVSIRSEPKFKINYTHKSYYGIEPVKEIQDNTYLGDSFYDYNRIRFRTSKHWRAGLVTHKDIGEANYLDYINGFIEYDRKQMKIIAGSYYAHFGEGLAFSNAYGQRKSSAASLAFRMNNQGGFATTSTSENSGLFGISMEIRKLSGSDLHVFFSHAARDAQLTRDRNYITGIDYDGYHRSASEILKKDRIKESLLGFTWQRPLSKFINMGVQTSAIRYDPDLKFEPDIVGETAYRRQYFKFSGSKINQFSIFYLFNLSDLLLRGEYAGSQHGSPGITQSIFIEKDKINFGIKYWRLSKNFQSPYGRVFDNASPFPQAEEGIYTGLALQPFQNFTINSFKILKKDLWRTYFNEMPKINDETFIELNWQPDNLNFLARMRAKDNEYFTDPETHSPVSRNTERQNIFRLQLDYRPGRQLTFRTRWEYTELNILQEQGSYLFEDIYYTPVSKWSIRTRVLFYRTDSYNSRLYEYESDLPGSFSNYAVFGEGRIIYLLLKWKITKKISIWLKYRYNYILNKDYTPVRIWKNDSELKRSLRFQLKIQI